MAENLGMALVQLFGRETVERAGLMDLARARPSDLAGVAEEGSGEIQPAALPGENVSLEQLIAAANAHYEQAQVALREGNWAAYGVEMEALQATLDQLLQITGGLPAPGPADEP
jgi:hypothetical protein